MPKASSGGAVPPLAPASEPPVVKEEKEDMPSPQQPNGGGAPQGAPQGMPQGMSRVQAMQQMMGGGGMSPGMMGGPTQGGPPPGAAAPQPTPAQASPSASRPPMQSGSGRSKSKLPIDKDLAFDAMAVVVSIIVFVFIYGWMGRSAPQMRSTLDAILPLILTLPPLIRDLKDARGGVNVTWLTLAALALSFIVVGSYLGQLSILWKLPNADTMRFWIQVVAFGLAYAQSYRQAKGFPQLYSYASMGLIGAMLIHSFGILAKVKEVV